MKLLQHLLIALGSAALLAHAGDDIDSTIYVHLVPHSYNPTFLSQLDDFFPWQQEELMQMHLSQVFTQVVAALSNDPRRTFTHYEVKYFAKWYSQQSEGVKESVRGLVQMGQLEFVNGGWEMHDEACPTYQDMIMNIQVGHRFLMEELSYVPRVALSVGDSGHSLAHPRVMSEAGLQSMYLLNVNEDERWQRRQDKALQFLWRPMFSTIGRRTEIFTHVLYDYDVSPLDLLVGDKDSQKSIDGHVSFRDYVLEMRTHYDSNHLLMMVGSGLNFEKVELYLQDVQRVIDHFNRVDSDIKVIFSTLSYYDESISVFKGDLPVYYKDFLPYSPDNNYFTTGLFTSRQNLKAYARRASQVLHASGKVYQARLMEHAHTHFTESKENIKNKDEADAMLKGYNSLQQAVASAQTTDIITGTCRTGTSWIHQINLEKGIEAAFTSMTTLIDEWAEAIAGIQTKQPWEWCYRFYTSFKDCPVGDPNKNANAPNFLVAMMNPSLTQVNRTRIAVPHANFSVHVYNESSKEFVLTPSVVLCDPDHFGLDPKQENCWLHALQPIGGHAIQFMLVQRNTSSKGRADSYAHFGNTTMIDNDHQEFQYKGFQQDIGAAFTLQKKRYMTTFHIAFDLRYYPSYQGFEGTRSGASIFRPFTNESLRYCQGKGPSKIYYQDSTIVQQVTMIYECSDGGNATVKARMFLEDPVIEWDVTTEAIPVADGQGKELTVNFYCKEIDNQGKFHTDANGLEMLERSLRYYGRSPTPGDISASFYPVSTAIALRDKEDQSFEDLTIMTTRTQGASATQKGRIELMHARRVLFDDRVSKEIILNDTDISAATQSTYYMQIFDRQFEQSRLREYQLTEIDSPIEYFFNFDHWLNSFRVSEEAQPLILSNLGFPPSARVELTPLNLTYYLLRVDNVFDTFESQRQSTHYLNLNLLERHFEDKIFKGKTPADVAVIIQEVSFGGFEPMRYMISNKMAWTGVDDETLDYSMIGKDKNQNMLFIGPQRIRVFSVKIEQGANHTKPEDPVGPVAVGME
ncbi:hypothetical protein FGO68_gene4646 [Halteria grandinella]|uniref:Alpha-mannosidase n=1 Tax=Halteria grandinella TaxID=5974 RepID=A0A8J8P0K8_HALGN|nr:hypothetical protein FGO68_gene4646 [Halteria grandinella]